MINVDDRLLNELDESEMYLVLHIAKHMKANRMTAWPSIPTLAKACKWDERTVKTHRQSLIEKGFLHMEVTPGKPTQYRFLKKGIGIYHGLDTDEQIAEKEDAKNDGGTKNEGAFLAEMGVQKMRVERGQNLYPEDIKGIKKNEVIKEVAAAPLTPPFTKVTVIDPETPDFKVFDLYPAEENKKKKKTSPGGGPGGDGWTKRVASIFDAVASENGIEPFNWQINAGRDFKALKEIRAAMVVDIQRKKNHEPTEPEIESGFEYVFRYGFKYLSDVASGRGGIVQFSPTTIKNCYNQIVLYAKQSVNGTLKNGQHNGTNKATAQHLELANYIIQRRAAAMERRANEQGMADASTEREF